jgi:hypothetical protein
MAEPPSHYSLASAFPQTSIFSPPPDSIQFVCAPGCPSFGDLDASNPEVWVRCQGDNLEAFVDRGDLVRVAFQALQFSGDGTPSRVPAAIQKDLTRWAQAVDLSKLATLHPRCGLGPGGLER